MSNMIGGWLCVLAMITAICLPVQAATIRVPDDAPTIKEGLAMASATDEVVVACGTYFEHDIELKSRVRLTSESGEPNCVTIDAQGLGPVLTGRFLSSSTEVVGLTITGGHIEAVFGEGGSGGGLLLLDNSRPLISNCVIVENYAEQDGGGVYCGIGSSAKFENCLITRNEAGNGGSGMRFELNSSPTLTNCTITENIGTGVWLGNSSVARFINCVISKNDQEGVRVHGPAGNPQFEDCVVTENGERGAHVWSATLTMIGCTISKNQASAGAGFFLLDGEVALENCDVVENTAVGEGGAFYIEFRNGPSMFSASDSRFSGNQAGNHAPIGFIESGGAATLTCSVESDSGIFGDGTVTVDNSDCTTAVEADTWSAVKSVYR